MNDRAKSAGGIEWSDLTVPDAEGIREFYEAVIGWTSAPVEMGDYRDFCMNKPEDGETVAGICHARGENAGIPAQWLIYVNVKSLEQSVMECESRGGKVLHGPRNLGGGRCTVIQDPAGACVALFEHSTNA